MKFQYEAIYIIMFFMIFISIQYTLNKILVVLKEIKAILLMKKDKKE